MCMQPTASGKWAVMVWNLNDVWMYFSTITQCCSINQWCHAIISALLALLMFALHRLWEFSFCFLLSSMFFLSSPFATARPFFVFTFTVNWTVVVCIWNVFPLSIINSSVLHFQSSNSSMTEKIYKNFVFAFHWQYVHFDQYTRLKICQCNNKECNFFAAFVMT